MDKLYIYFNAEINVINMILLRNKRLIIDDKWNEYLPKYKIVNKLRIKIKNKINPIVW